MSKKIKLARINSAASTRILEIKAILEVLSKTEQGNYPANVLLKIANKKLVNVII